MLSTSKVTSSDINIFYIISLIYSFTSAFTRIGSKFLFYKKNFNYINEKNLIIYYIIFTLQYYFMLMY